MWFELFDLLQQYSPFFNTRIQFYGRQFFHGPTGGWAAGCKLDFYKKSTALILPMYRFGVSKFGVWWGPIFWFMIWGLLLVSSQGGRVEAGLWSPFWDYQPKIPSSRLQNELRQKFLTVVFLWSNRMVSNAIIQEIKTIVLPVKMLHHWRTLV